jgi:hypothetical protein
MILYHYSRKRFWILNPIIGSTRHHGEDATAVGKPVVWLTTSDNDQTIEGGTVVSVYRHRVEISEADPNLTRDEKKEKLDSDFERMFLGSRGSSWFFHFKRRLVVEIAKWDKDSKCYIRRFDPLVWLFAKIIPLRNR